MTLPDTNPFEDHQYMLDNFHAWYNTTGANFITSVDDAWKVFYTVLAHDWKHYNAD